MARSFWFTDADGNRIKGVPRHAVPQMEANVESSSSIGNILRARKLVSNARKVHKQFKEKNAMKIIRDQDRARSEMLKGVDDEKKSYDALYQNIEKEREKLMKLIENAEKDEEKIQHMRGESVKEAWAKQSDSTIKKQLKDLEKEKKRTQKEIGEKLDIIKGQQELLESQKPYVKNYDDLVKIYKRQDDLQVMKNALNDALGKSPDSAVHVTPPTGFSVDDASQPARKSAIYLGLPL